MPNWCLNTVTFDHANPKMMKKLVDAWNDGEFFQTMIPIPESAKEDWHSWCVSNWGTKWDVGRETKEPPVVLIDGTLTLNFDTAWAPPIEFYEGLRDMGYKITAYYWEPGMCFAGSWKDGIDDYYEEVDDADSAEKNLPADLNEMMAISENLSLWAEEA
jgi:hypothetical protein